VLDSSHVKSVASPSSVLSIVSLTRSLPSLDMSNSFASQIYQRLLMSIPTGSTRAILSQRTLRRTMHHRVEL